MLPEMAIPPRKVGRPRAEQPLRSMSVRLSDDTYEALYAYARESGKEVSVVIRELIDRVLERRRAPR